MTIGAKQPPKTLNEVYTIAANWIKTQPQYRRGQAATFVTTNLETKSTGKGKGGNGKSKQYALYAERLANTRCHKCKNMGRFTNQCPTQKEVAQATAISGNDDEDNASFHVNATWQQHAVFNTTREVSVNAAVDPRVKVQSDWVLLDNQLDISIVHPSYF